MRPISLLLCACAAAALPSAALGHGGLPVSMHVLWRGETMYVPTLYWGMFVGSASGPWHWICDESINKFMQRDVLLGGDGTFYATDTSGMTLSRDGGCTWTEVTGDLATLDLTAIATDPASPTRAWTTSSADGGQGTLWRSDDSGATWNMAFTDPAVTMRGVAVSPDGRTIHLVASTSGAMSAPVLYTSQDGGANFMQRPIAPVPTDVIPDEVAILRVDPRDPRVAYLRFEGDTNQVLVRADTGSGTFTPMLDLMYPIFAADVNGDRLLVSTGDGIYYADGTAMLTRSPGLSRAQCVSPQGDKLFACSWDYMPDEKAVALSTDDGQSFSRIFQYADTLGIVQCPAASTVARVCPASWAMNAPLLGIDPSNPGPMPMQSDSGCNAAGRPAGAGLPAVAALILIGLAVRRRAIGRGATVPAPIVRGRAGG